MVPRGRLDLPLTLYPFDGRVEAYSCGSKPLIRAPTVRVYSGTSARPFDMVASDMPGAASEAGNRYVRRQKEDVTDQSAM